MEGRVTNSTYLWHHSGFKAGAFGGVALFAVIFYASGIPRVQNDILMKIPGLSKYYVKDIPASDNVSRACYQAKSETQN